LINDMQRKNFSRELARILAGPPKISQTQLCKRTGLVKSKVCRLLSDSIPPDRSTLSAILKVLPRRDQKIRLTSAYVEDLTPREGLLLLNNGKNPWAALRLSRVSPRASASLAALLDSHHHATVEKLLIDLAIGFDLI
jgi:hypothetical protein